MAFVKVVCIGDSSVGKTSIIQQYVNRRFAADFRPTVGTDFAAKPVSIGDDLVNLQLWDTAGQERFRSLTTSYYKGSEVAVVCFDLTQLETFEHVEEWVDEFKRTCHIDPQERFPIFVVGNKSDLEQERAIMKSDALRHCQAKGWQYFETSAKLADNVDALFRECAQAAVTRRKQKTYLDEFSSGGANGDGNNNNNNGRGGGGGGVQRAKLVPLGRPTNQNNEEKKKFSCSGCGGGGGNN